MVEMYDVIEKELNLEDYLNYNIRRIAVLLNCNIIGIVLFDDDDKFTVLKNAVIRKSNEYVKLNKKRLRVIKIESKSILKLAKKEKKIVVYQNNEEKEYSPVSNVSSSEMIIPIFDNYIGNNGDSTDVIASIYISTFDVNVNLTIDDIEDKEISKRIVKIQNLYQAIYLKKQKKKMLTNLLNIFSEIVNDNDSNGILHPYHVANISKEIGKALRLDYTTLKKIYIAGLLHDVGKLYIDNDILSNKGKLTEEEYNIIKEHPGYGANIAKDIFGLEDISRLIRCHHERYDGMGYPEGIKGEEIPLGSRIICLADSVDAMLSPRSYKEPRNVEFVISELLKNRGKQFDAELVDIMINMLLKTNEETEDILSDDIIWSTLTVYTKEKETEKVYSIEGTLGKYDFGYYFKANKFNFSHEIEMKDITSINLYVNKNNSMYCYKIKEDYCENNTLHISSFEYIPFVDSFNILWDLDGSICLQSFENININIYKIGGSRLMFYIDKEQVKEGMLDKILNMEVYFKDAKNIKLTGKIVNNFNVANKIHYEFLYVNVRDIVIDQLFRNIFSKQMELKRFITKVI